MVAIALGLIFGFTILFLSMMFLGALVATWPLWLVVGLWLLVRETRLRMELAREP